MIRIIQTSFSKLGQKDLKTLWVFTLYWRKMHSTEHWTIFILTESCPPLVWLIVCTVHTYNDLVLSFSEGGKLIFSQLFFIWIHTYILPINDLMTITLWYYFFQHFWENCSIFYSWKYNARTWCTRKIISEIFQFERQVLQFVLFDCHLILPFRQWWASFRIWFKRLCQHHCKKSGQLVQCTGQNFSAAKL